MVPALADIGAMRGLAHRVQVQAAGQLLQIVKCVSHGGARLQPVRLGLRTPGSSLDLNQFRNGSHKAVDTAHSIVSPTCYCTRDPRGRWPTYSGAGLETGADGVASSPKTFQ